MNRPHAARELPLTGFEREATSKALVLTQNRHFKQEPAREKAISVMCEQGTVGC